MRYLFFVLSLIPTILISQNPVGGAGVCHVNGNPNSITALNNQDPRSTCQIAIDTLSGNVYRYYSNLPLGSRWMIRYDSVGFLSNNNAVVTGRLQYSDEIGDFIFGGLGDVQLGATNTHAWYVRNDTTITLTKGMVVYASGTLGASGRIKVKPFIADGSIPTKYVLGVLASNIAVGGDGYAFDIGKIRQINTDTFAQGAILYASPFIRGALTDIEPVAPNPRMPIAFVLHNASNGILAVRLSDAETLNDISDVNVAGATNGQVLTYNAGVWGASTIIGGSGTAGTIPLWNTSTTLSNSTLTEASGNVTAGGTGSFRLPNGTTAERPGSAVNGMTRYNTTNNAFEYYRTSSWETPLLSATATGLGTASRVFYSDANGKSATSNDLTWDIPNSRLGIGTTTPNAKLQIKTSDALNSSIAFNIQNSTPTNLFQISNEGQTIFQPGNEKYDGGILGSELLSSTGWTTTGWTGDFTNGFSHTPGNTNVLSNTLAAVTNSYYQINYIVANRTAGSFTIAFGGVSFASLNATGNIGPRAINTNNLTITPTSDFNGTLILSIKLITLGNGLIQFNSSNGTPVNQVRFGNTSSCISFGVNAGRRNTTGIFNTFFSSNAGENNTTGSNNNFFGASSGSTNTTGNNNNFFGLSTGVNNISGSNNNFIGFNSGSANTSGSGNNFLGERAGQSFASGSNNIAIGTNSGYNTGSSSLFGSNNIFIGNATSRNITQGASNNVIIGNSINLPVVDGSDQLSISNLIFGTGASATGTSIPAGGRVGIKTNSPQQDFHVQGTARITGLTATPTKIVGANNNNDLGAIGVIAPFGITTSGEPALTFSTQVANTFLAGPTTGANAVPTFRAIVAGDIPTLNQNTTGSAATLLTTRTLWGQNFNGSANVLGHMTDVGNITLGTQTNKATITYPTNQTRTYTIPDAGANANFVMTEGTQTINGTKTFGSTISGSINGNAATVTNGVYTSRNINTANSLTGGGSLTADRTLSLVGDAATPGNSKYYGTNSSGTKGFHDLPSGGSSDGNGIYSGSGTVPTGTVNTVLSSGTTFNIRFTSTGDVTGLQFINATSANNRFINILKPDPSDSEIQFTASDFGIDILDARNIIDGFSTRTRGITLLSAAGSGATQSIAGGQMNIKVTLTTGTTPTSGDLFKITNLDDNFGAILNPVFSAGNAATAERISDLYVNVVSNSDSEFSITTRNALAASTTYIFHIQIGRY